MSNTSSSPTIGNAINILRQRFFIDHSSTAKTFTVEEYTIRANENKVRDILLIVNTYLINLHVYDADGEKLSLMSNIDTNTLVEMMIEESTGENKKQLELLKMEMKEHNKYLLWIQLPVSKKMGKNDIRTISLEYDAKKEKKTPKEFEMDFLHQANHVVMYSIKKPDDFEFKKQKIETQTEDGQKLEFTGWDNDQQNLIYVDKSIKSTSVTIKKEVQNPIQFIYSFRPSWNIIKFPLLVLLVLWGSSINLLFLKILCRYLLDDCKLSLWEGAILLSDKTIDVGVAIVAASLIIPGLIQNQSIRHLFTKFVFVPIILALMAILL